MKVKLSDLATDDLIYFSIAGGTKNISPYLLQ